MSRDICSFCRRGVGVGSHEGILQHFETMTPAQRALLKVDVDAMISRLRKQPDRRVRLLVPGPGDLRICDLCVDLYAETVERELRAQG